MLSSKLKILAIAVFGLLLFSDYSYSQIFQASPANWLFPEGNAESTKHVERRSLKQSFDSITVKWSTSHISGDVRPLIGNIINNPKILDAFPFAPNEIVAVIGDSLVLIGGDGKIYKKTWLPPYIKGISCLFDSLNAQVTSDTRFPVVLGLETIEHHRQDSLVNAYIAAFDQFSDTISVITRLALDLRPYNPNIFASIRPIYGRNQDNTMQIYATVNIASPYAPEPFPVLPPYLRGLCQFNTNPLKYFPLPDVGDNIMNRVNVGPEVAFTQPSISALPDGRTIALLPSYHTPNLNVQIETFVNGQSIQTSGDRPWLMGFDISSFLISEYVFTTDLSTIIPENSRPVFKPYFVKITDGNGLAQSPMILLTESYKGIESSSGQSMLHLYDVFGDPVTMPGNPANPSFPGGRDYVWSVAVGDVDGSPVNEWGELYPNNPGNEIIVSLSSREFDIANSRILIMRYNSGSPQKKPSPPDSYLFPFDTIASQRINGWVAAVNDLDGADDLKDEILVVDGSKLMALRLRNYNDYLFRIGRIFDTVWVRNFPNQTISSVAIADLEGDGRNDIIVTTFDSLYVFGSLIQNIIQVTEPVAYNDPPLDVCAGDTVEIKWQNKMRGVDRVNIWFQPYFNGFPTGEKIYIRRNLLNNKENVVYKYPADTLVIGRQGRFIVESSFAPDMNFDTTSFLRFEIPSVSLNYIPDTTKFRMGTEFIVTGRGACVDSLSLEYSLDRQSWIKWTATKIKPDGTFEARVEIPCLEIFPCSFRTGDSVVFVQALSHRSIYVDTIAVIPVRLLPAWLDFKLEPNERACPARKISWNAKDIKFKCDNIDLSFSIDGGRNFSLIEQVPASAESFIWDIPFGLPDNIILRLCCENSCIISDTLITDIQPKYVNIIAPNPFKPLYEEMEVVYVVPGETNVTIKIYDQSNRLVSEIVSNQSRSKGLVYCDRWNGLRSDGSPAANGMYYLSLEFSDGSREIHPVFIRK